VSEPGFAQKLANRIFKREALLMLTVIVVSAAGAVYGQARLEAKLDESAKKHVEPVKASHDDLERRFVRHEGAEDLRWSHIEKKLDRFEQLLLEDRAARAAGRK
jgi:hypothetical protein